MLKYKIPQIVTLTQKYLFYRKSKGDKIKKGATPCSNLC